MKTWFTIDGRRKRLSFFLSFIALFLIYLAVLSFIGAITGLELLDYVLFGGYVLDRETTGIVCIAVSLPFLWPNIALTVQRLHDLGCPGWWAVLGAIPYLNFVFYLFLYLLPSSKYDNKYGRATSADYIPSYA